MSVKFITEIFASFQTVSFPCPCGVSTTCPLSEQADKISVLGFADLVLK